MNFLETLGYTTDLQLFTEFYTADRLAAFYIASEKLITDTQRQKLVYAAAVLQEQFPNVEFLIEIVDTIEPDFMETEKDVYFVEPEKFFQIEADQAFVMSQQTFLECYLQEHFESVSKTIADWLKDTFREKRFLCAVAHKGEYDGTQ